MRTRNVALPAVAALLAAVVVSVLASVAVTRAVVDDHPHAERWGMTGMAGMHGMTGMQGMTGMHGMPGRQGMPGTVVADEEDYLAAMIPHHEEAIAAARELERSARPEMRSLGRSVVEGQTAEVRQMEGWLDRWYDGRKADSDYRPMMRDLSRLEGDALDRAFLEDMVGHHMMAVMMSQRLLVAGAAEHDEVAELAAAIRDGQHAEIFTMQRWLREWFGR